jgi:DNA processing protein
MMGTETAASRLARAALTCVADPADPVLAALLRSHTPVEIMAALTAGRMPDGPRSSPVGSPGRPPPHAGARPRAAALERVWPRWAARLGDAPSQADMDRWQRAGIRLVIPGDAEWPGQLDVLGDTRPWGLWVRGNADLRYVCLRSVAVVGTRAATGYGTHVCGEVSLGLAERGWTIVSGGAYGIDGWAHRGALAAEGATVAVLACGVDRAYPLGHEALFADMCDAGAIVSEWPPGRGPTRPGFLVRNRLIAALSRGTVVVEAAVRSGALNTARHARDQGRPLMAVPGPVTSAQSAGCHQIIRDWNGICVTCAEDVAELLSFSASEPRQRGRGPVMPRDQLDPVQRRVLEAVPVHAGQGPARIAVGAGVDFDTAMTCLGALAAAGFVERCARGWRLRREPRQPTATEVG